MPKKKAVKKKTTQNKKRVKTVNKSTTKTTHKKEIKNVIEQTQFATLVNNQEKILKKLNILEQIEQEIKHEEQELLSEEGQLEKLAQLEKDLEKEIHVSPLRKITYKDITKSMIGAFFGILGHFSFYYGAQIALHISVFRASLLYIVAFLIGGIFLYLTGFRKVKNPTTLWFAPIRLLVIYSVSIMMVIIILLLFNYINPYEQTFFDMYKTVATVSILAVMGALTADLLGRNEE